MEKSFFLGKIRESYKDYGDDPWIFLRELAQNSRDSGAGEIRIDIGGYGENKEVIIFSDNGKGMSFGEAKKYLFRLYSSSKTGEKYSLGMYGVGFWSVMKFSPLKITIESYSEEEEMWGIEIGPDLTYIKTDCRLNRYGTRITLEREAQFESFNKFSDEVKKGIFRYCAHLEKPEGNEINVQVIYQGQHIVEKIRQKTGISLKYRGRDFEGIVSLGNEPMVSLFTGGIPAWEGSSLDELTLINGDYKNNCGYIDSGIAPVFTINGRSLKVNMNRLEVIDDRPLKKIVVQSRKALDRLIRSYINYAYPRGFFERIFYRIKRFSTSVLSSYWKLIAALLILVVPIEFVILSNIFDKHKNSTIEDVAPEVLKTRGYRNYRPTVGKIGEKAVADIKYSPPENVWFRMFTADSYSRGNGFVRSDSKNNSPSKSVLFLKSGKPFFINIKLDSGGEIFLPVPDGYSIDPASVSINGMSMGISGISSPDATLIIKESGKNEIEYICFPNLIAGELNKRYIAGFTRLPRSIRFPEKVENLILKNVNKSIGEKVELCRNISNILLKYDNSSETFHFYKYSSNFDDWLKKVLEIGAGDCDIINGLNALLLRKMGVATRVVVGLLGVNGRVEPDLHAWTEYYDEGWKKTDASLTADVVRNDLDLRKSAGLKDTFTMVRYFESSEKMRKVGIGEILIFLIIVLFVPFLFILKNSRQKKRDISAGFEFRNRVEIKQDIAKIARSYLLNPDVWGVGLNIFDRKIVTTMQGNRLSLKELLSFSYSGKIFSGRKDNQYVRKLINSKTDILDSNDKIFEPMIRIIPGIFDLDMLLKLSIELEGANRDNGVKIFLSKVNSILADSGGSGVICLNAPGLTDEYMRDIDLSGIKERTFFEKFKIPKKFIAVNFFNPELSEIFSEYEENAYTSIFLFIKKLIDNSVFFINNTDRVKKKAIEIIVKRGV